MLTFLKRLAASVPTPATDKVTVFVEDSTGEPSYKDDTGTVASLKGDPGEGVPAGGTAGQVLRKIDSADYNTEWGSPPGASRTYIIVTEASAFTATPATHAGLDTYNRCGGDVTFDSAQSYVAGQAYNIRATSTISLTGTGVTLTPPAGGTLDLEADMAVQVVMTSSTAGDVIGQTVPA